MAEDRASILNWGARWLPIRGSNALQTELDRELAQRHPLFNARPVVIGRCVTCDDIVATLAHAAGEPELAVVHLTWSGRPEKLEPSGTAWPYFERLTLDEFVSRFVEGGEHL